jgi:DNA-binding transcriptional LysR family regulator
MRRPYKDLGLSQLRSFVAVCRLGGYAETARQLGVSTSTVWEQMRGLDRQLGVALLESAGGRVRPTPEGQQLLELVRPLLAGLESAKEVLHQQRGRPPEQITLVSGMRMLLEEVGEALARFRDRYPTVRLRCLYAEDRTIEALVGHGEADLGLMLEPGPGRAPDPALVYEPAYELEYVLVTPPRHPLARRRGLRLRDVARHPLVVGTPGTTSRRRIEEVFHHHGLLRALHIAVETNSAAMTLAYVRAGAGVGIAGGYRRGALAQGLGIRPLGRWFGAARFVFVWQRGAYAPPAQRELADLIRAAVAGGDSPGP